MSLTVILGLITTVGGAITAIFVGAPKILSWWKSYFPPKSTEQKVEDSEKAVADQIKKEQESGRP